MEAFNKIQKEDKQTIADRSFLEGFDERGLVALGATLGRDSRVSALGISEQAITMNTKLIVRNRHRKSSKNALVGDLASHSGTAGYSFDGAGSIFLREHSRSSAETDSAEANYMLLAPGKDARGRGGMNFVINSKGKGGRRSAPHEGTIRCFGSEGKWSLAIGCHTPAPSADQWKKELVLYRCGKPGHVRAEWQQMVARRTEPNFSSAAPIQTPSLPIQLHESGLVSVRSGVNQRLRVESPVGVQCKQRFGTAQCQNYAASELAMGQSRSSALIGNRTIAQQPTGTLQCSTM